MKVKLRRPFTYQDGPRNTVTLQPGVHDLPDRLAGLALRFGKAELVVEKKAPENKVVATAESKSKVSKSRRSSAGSEPDA
jgi:hypothetical protein